MKKIVVLLLVSFIVSSCVYEDSSFKKMSKKQLMKSWTWKIFVFTDEGELAPIHNSRANLKKSINDKENDIYTAWQKHIHDNLFLKKYQIAFTEKEKNSIFKKAN